MEFSTQPSNPSYIPYFMSGLSENMNFMQRVQNFLLKIGHTICSQINFYSKNIVCEIQEIEAFNGGNCCSK